MVHQQLSQDQYFKQLMEEFNKEQEIRSLVLTAHLFIEYWINEIIMNIFPQGKIIFKNKELRGFSSKIDILTAFGVFEKDEDLLYNITQINQLRNKYAHNLIIKESEVNKSIKQLKLIPNNLSENINSFDLISQFKMKTVITILTLHSVFNRF
ncbi:hypothetical protein HYY69_05415 [Candidatus Woesearchaeota archaeon]|nr:hypothetical protein [Candidatus Woesearchaeota archaeon]